MQDIVDVLPRRLRGARDQPEQTFVRVRLAEQVDGLVGEELASEIAAVGFRQVIAEAREDDAVQSADLTAARRSVGFDPERQGPVAQRVFKTREVWQPQAG